MHTIACMPPNMYIPDRVSGRRPQVLGAVLRSLGGPRAPAQLTGSVFLWDR